MMQAHHYVDRTTWNAERSLFQRSWLLMGHIDSLPVGRATAQRVHDLPILLWHHEEGLRAFLNVCPHRAGPLILEGEQQECSRLRCRYHGWQFDELGDLVRTPNFGGEAGEHSLRQVRVQVWRGLIFVSLSAKKPLDLKLDPPPWDGMPHLQTARHVLKCNWKTYVENYLEGYHIPYIHPALTAELKMNTYKVEAANGIAVHRVKSRDGAMNAGFWAWIWPNTALNLYDGGLCLERIVPISPNETAIEYTYRFAAGLSAEERAERVASSAKTTEEDTWICEAVAKNLQSGHASPGPLSPAHEQGLVHFHKLWKKAIVAR